MSSDPLSFLTDYSDENRDNSKREDPLSFLEEKKNGPLRKAGRLAYQYGKGALQTAALPYELATAPESSKNKQLASYRENLFDDIERLLEQKQTGVWDKQDQELLDNLTKQAANPQESEKFLKTSKIGVGDILEKGGSKIGLDLAPEDVSEHVAGFVGNLRNPKELLKTGRSIASLPSKFSKDARESIKWDKLFKAHEKDPAKSSMLDYVVEHNLTPEEATLVLQSRGNIDVLGQLAKKTKKFKKTVSSLKEKLSGNYDELKKIGQEGGYLNAQEKIPIIRDLEEIITKTHNPLGIGPETQKAVSSVENTLEGIKHNQFSIKDIINKRQAIRQGKDNINWKDVDHGDVLKKELIDKLDDSIKRLDPSLFNRLKKTDSAWSQYKKYEKLLNKKQAPVKWKGIEIPNFGANLLFLGALHFGGITGVGLLKGLAIKEGVQRLSTELLMNPKFQNVHKRLLDSVLSGSKKNQKEALSLMKSILKKEDPDLYEDFIDLQIE